MPRSSIYTAPGGCWQNLSYQSQLTTSHCEKHKPITQLYLAHPPSSSGEFDKFPWWMASFLAQRRSAWLLSHQQLLSGARVPERRTKLVAHVPNDLRLIE